MEKSFNSLLLLAIFCLVGLWGYGQAKRVVSGTIRDNNGSPVSGGSVLVKGTKIATAADLQGHFKIEVPGSSNILVISSVGFETQELKISSDNNVDISLKVATGQLNEVVVTGFGEKRQKRNLGYSIAQVSGDAIRGTATISPVDALVGQVAGLQVQSGVGGPSATPKIVLRGSSVLNSYGNQPLFVVDGVIIDNQTATANKANQYGDGPDFGNILKDINPDDIDNISVLKGGSVTALYGSQAANGVILITTKKGSSARGLGINVSSTDMLIQPYKTVDFQNQFGAGLGANDWDHTTSGGLKILNGYGVSFGPAMTGQMVTDINGIVRPNNPLPNNILDFFQNGHDINNNASFSGGNEKSSFRFSYSNNASTGIIANNNLKRNAFAVRALHKVNDFLSFDANLSYTNTYTKGPQMQGGASPLYQLAYAGVRNWDTKYWLNNYIDPVNGGVSTVDQSGILGQIFSIYQNNIFQKENNLRGAIEATFKFSSWLNFQAGAYLNLFDKYQEQDKRGQAVGFSNPTLYYASDNYLSQRYKGLFNVNKSINKDFTLFAQFGGETNYGSHNGQSVDSKNSPAVLPDIYRISNFNNPSQFVISELSPASQRLTSIYAQAGVSWRNILSLNVYGRNEWNSSLVYNDGHGKYSYAYYGADAAFVFSDLIKNKPKFFDYGKVRFSYNKVGTGTDPYTANTGAYSQNGTYTTTSGTPLSFYTFQNNTLGNQSLVPQSVNTWETGLEAEGLGRRVGFDFTFYHKLTSNQIIPFNVPSTSGVQSALVNSGAVSNTGYEFSAWVVPVRTANFSWTTRLLFYHNSNKIVSLPFGVQEVKLDGDDGISVVARAGGDYGLMVANYGYARYQANSSNGNKSNYNGMPILGNRFNNTEAIYLRAGNVGTTPETQEPVIGSIQPKFNGTWSNTFTYKAFSLNTSIDARIGGIEYSTTYFYGQQAGSLANTLYGRNAALGGVSYTTSSQQGPSTTYMDGNELQPNQARTDGIILNGVFAPNTQMVGPDGKSHDVSNMTMKDAVAQGLANPVPATDYYIHTFSWSHGIREAGTFTNSWVALRQVSIGYELPRSISKKLKLNNLRVSVIGRNLLYLYNSAPDHIFPENVDDSGSASAFERGGSPYTRSVGVKLEANF